MQGLKIGEPRTALNDKGLSVVGLEAELAWQLGAAPLGSEVVPMGFPGGCGGFDGDYGVGSSALEALWRRRGQRGFVFALSEAKHASVCLAAALRSAFLSTTSAASTPRRPLRLITTKKQLRWDPRRRQGSGPGEMFRAALLAAPVAAAHI